MINFDYLYNIFQNFLELGTILYNWLNTKVTIGGVKFDVWTLVIASGLTVGLGVRIVRSFLGN